MRAVMCVCGCVCVDVCVGVYVCLSVGFGAGSRHFAEALIQMQRHTMRGTLCTFACQKTIKNRGMQGIGWDRFSLPGNWLVLGKMRPS